MIKVNFNSLKRSYELHQEEYEKKALEVLRSGWYVLGEEVKQFENEWGEAVGSKYCVGVDNGLNAIALGIRALGIGAGDEVILQSNAYIATVMGVTINGAAPVFTEPNEFYNIDYRNIEEKITSRTKAILVTHLYGQASKMDKIQELCEKYKLFLLEDCAQSHLAAYNSQKTGTFGDMGFFSFYPTKNLGGFGDGGAVVTDHKEWDSSIRMLRNYGSSNKYYNKVVGQNARLDEIQAGLLRVKAKHLSELTEERQAIAKRYLTEINNPSIVLPGIEAGATHVWHLFVIRVEEREEFKAHMLQCEIQTDVHYPIPPHLSEAYSYLGLKQGDYPIAERYANTVVSLPLFNGMTQEEIEWVIESINSYKK